MEAEGACEASPAFGTACCPAGFDPLEKRFSSPLYRRADKRDELVDALGRGLPEQFCFAIVQADRFLRRWLAYLYTLVAI